MQAQQASGIQTSKKGLARLSGQERFAHISTLVWKLEHRVMLLSLMACTILQILLHVQRTAQSKTEGSATAKIESKLEIRRNQLERDITSIFDLT